MIVREIMTTKLITVTPDDTLSHAATLLRQHQFHHLPVVREAQAPRAGTSSYAISHAPLQPEGLLTSADIDLAVELDKRHFSDQALEKPWQERRVVEVMHLAPLCVTPTTSVAAAAQILVERGLHCLPVVEYAASELSEGAEPDASPLLVGLVTRSDLLIALAHMTGSSEPGMQLILPLPPHDVTPLAKMLMLAAELHIRVTSVLTVEHKEGEERVATVYISTIYPAPLLRRLHEQGIKYRFAGFQLEGETHVATR
jgi:acetoin utilization protein AcuB